MKKKVLFPAFLAALALPLCLHSNPINLNAEFIGEYDVKADYVAFAKEVNGQMADEGFVLLKNDGFLPMSGNESLSVVGKASIKLARGGAGSGSGSIDGTVGSDSKLNLKASLTEAGFTLNPNTDAFYNDGGKSGSGRTNGNDGWKGNSEVTIGETPIESVLKEEGLVDSFYEYNDAAIMVIAREGSEGCDVKTCNCHDSKKTNSSSKVVSNKHALELSDNEQALFDLLHEHFDHIIMIINSSNIFECGQFQDDEKVSGVLWIGNPGDVGPMAIGRILSGEVNPSGRTVDTWARDFTADPTFQNFSDNAQTNLVEINGEEYYAPQDTMLNADGTPMRSYGTDKSYKDTSKPNWDSARGGADAMVVSGGINGVKPAAYVSYEEGIYVDYRYYETKYADMAKENKAAADDWYKGETGVVYPFGYGLSYTTFEQKIIRVAPAKGASLQANDIIDVSVKVTNTGSAAGKDTVQLYWKAPYTKGGIEKADHVLCAFDKTDEIKPGESQIMQLSFHLQDVANYDCFDANNNNFCGYELDAGDYELMLMKNAHEAYGYVPFKIEGQGIQYETDRFTGYKVENRFTDCGFNDTMPGEKDIEFTQFSRANFEETFPTHPTLEDRKVKEGSRYEEFLTHTVTIEEFEQGNYEYIPEAAHVDKQTFIDNGWKQETPSPRTQLSAMKGIPYDDPRWESFINEFSYSEMLQYVEKNGMSTSKQDNIGKDGFSEGDGPQKFSIIWWVSSPIVAATFNPRLAHQQGECCGMESHINGKSGWWGPAVNTHRSPFGGRNFEYYSADPFLMGRMCAEVVRAATDRGIYAYFKHFAVNDQEKNRESGISFLTEQALREIYLKSFQMVFEEAQSIGVMSSYNRFGLMETAASYNLLTEVLRNEWGFKGCVLSDMAHASNSSIDFGCYENVNWRILGGCNLQLTQGSTFSGKCTASWSASGFDGKGCPVSGGVECYSFWYACRQLTKGYMYMAAQCTGMARGLTPVADEVNLTYKVGEDINYDVQVSGATEYKANLRVDTALPAGLEFADGSLTGKLDHVGLYRVDVIATVGNNKQAVKLVINVVPNEAEYDEGLMEIYKDEQPVNPTPDNGGNKKKGCFGDISSIYALAGLIALAGIGFILLSLTNKKRKEI